MDAPPLDAAIARATAWLKSRQGPAGWWDEPVTGSVDQTIRRVAEYVIVNRLLQRVPAERERGLIAWLLAQQNPDGSFGDASTSALVYQALKLACRSADDPPLVQARHAIVAAGGLVQCDLSVRRWLATLGEFPWTGVPTVPVELMLLPRWAPFSVAQVARGARVVVVARMLQSAHRWSAHLPPEQGVHELWVTPPTSATITYPSHAPDLSWRHLLVAGDRLARGIGYTPLVGLHRRAVARAIEWLLQQQLADGAWDDDLDTTATAVMALHAIGFAVDHPVMVQGLVAIDAAFAVHDGTVTIRPCHDVPWQTAHALRALRAVGLPATDPVLVAATTALEDVAPACVDTSATLAAALAPTAPPAWLIARQSWNGGYATTDVHQTASLWQQTALADERSLRDPPTPATTGRVLVAMAAAGCDRHLGRAWRAIEFLRTTCDPNRGWEGSVLATAAALQGLVAIGEPLTAPPFAAAVVWLRQMQQRDGQWEDGAVATAAAVEALVAVAGASDPAVDRGVGWLLAAQRPDGAWNGGLCRAGGCFAIAAATAPLAALGRVRAARADR